MSKEKMIVKLAKEGKSLKEILAANIARPVYVKTALTKNGFSWRTMKGKSKPTPEKTPTVQTLPEGEVSPNAKVVPAQPRSEKTVEINTNTGQVETTEEVPSIDSEMDKMEVKQEVKKVKENAMAALAVFMKSIGIENIIDSPMMVNAATEVAGNKEVRRMVNKCHRHPDVNVKPGENCEKCIFDSNQAAESTYRRDYVLPCPDCGDGKRQTDGGTIKKLLPSGHYSCGNCKVTYNTTGEKVPWGDKDLSYFEKAAKKGLY